MIGGNDLIIAAYSVTNALRLVSYAPQIWCVARDRSGAQAISCLSWNLWTAANGTTALYAWVLLHDLPLALVNAANAVCCATVVFLTLSKRAALRHAAPLAPPLAPERPDANEPVLPAYRRADLVRVERGRDGAARAVIGGAG